MHTVKSHKTQNDNNCLPASAPGRHTPEDFQFNFAGGNFAGLDRVLQGQAQRAPAADVQDLVVGLDAALLAGGRAWHHLQAVDALPFAADASRQLDPWVRKRTRREPS